MSLTAIITLFGTMVVLAAVPSLSVLTVTARAAASGFGHGLATALGIVAGDLVYVALAIFGLGVLVDAMGEAFVLLKLAGALYLLLLAWSLWTSASLSAAQGSAVRESHGSSFMAGLLLTLADHKAVLFYMVLLPAFVDLEALDAADVLTIVAVTIVAVGGVKAGYAWLASRSAAAIAPGWRSGINRCAAVLLIAVAAMLLSAAV